MIDVCQEIYSTKSSQANAKCLKDIRLHKEILSYLGSAEHEKNKRCSYGHIAKTKELYSQRKS